MLTSSSSFRAVGRIRFRIDTGLPKIKDSHARLALWKLTSPPDSSQDSRMHRSSLVSISDMMFSKLLPVNWIPAFLLIFSTCSSLPWKNIFLTLDEASGSSFGDWNLSSKYNLNEISSNLRFFMLEII